MLIVIAILLAAVMAVALVMYFMPSSKVIDAGLSAVPQAKNIDANIQASSNAAATKSIIEQAHFVGSETCTSCHQAQHQGWQQSHHSQAFAPANVDSVVGDFSTVSVNYRDGVAVFEQRPIDSKTHYQIRLQTFSSETSDSTEQIYATGSRWILLVTWLSRQ